MQHNIGLINRSKYSRLKKFIECKLLLIILVTSSIGYAQNPTEGEWMIVLNGKKAQIDNSITIGAPSDNKAPIMGI